MITVRKNQPTWEGLFSEWDPSSRVLMPSQPHGPRALLVLLDVWILQASFLPFSLLCRSFCYVFLLSHALLTDSLCARTSDAHRPQDVHFGRGSTSPCLLCTPTPAFSALSGISQNQWCSTPPKQGLQTTPKHPQVALPAVPSYFLGWEGWEVLFGCKDEHVAGRFWTSLQRASSIACWCVSCPKMSCQSYSMAFGCVKRGQFLMVSSIFLNVCVCFQLNTNFVARVKVLTHCPGS